MYAVDADDEVQPLPGIPPCDTGAPVPVVMTDEDNVVVAYIARGEPVDWDSARPDDLGEEAVAVLRFRGVRSMMFGAPNDESLSGHPLWGRGLAFYAAHQVVNSSWIRSHERMNRVHPLHSAERFSRLRHVILTFHDSTFECICEGQLEVSVTAGSTPRHAAAAALL